MTESNQYCILHDNNENQTNSKVIGPADNESNDYCNNFNSLKNENQIITKQKCCDKQLLQGKFNTVDPNNKKGIQFYKNRPNSNTSYRVCGNKTITECNNNWPSGWTTDQNLEWNKYDDYMKCLYDKTSPELKNNIIGHITLDHDGYTSRNYINPTDKLCPDPIENTDLLKYLVKFNKNNKNNINADINNKQNEINNINSKINVITSEIVNEQKKYNNKQDIIYIFNIIIISFIIISCIFLYSKYKKN